MTPFEQLLHKASHIPLHNWCKAGSESGLAEQTPLAEKHVHTEAVYIFKNPPPQCPIFIFKLHAHRALMAYVVLMAYVFQDVQQAAVWLCWRVEHAEAEVQIAWLCFCCWASVLV